MAGGVCNVAGERCMHRTTMASVSETKNGQVRKRSLRNVEKLW